MLVLMMEADLLGGVGPGGEGAGQTRLNRSLGTHGTRMWVGGVTLGKLNWPKKRKKEERLLI